VDCNNFYVSCERVFAPYLEAKPVVILSNNDGCVIARSEEVKRLGIAMGAPLHMIQPQVRQHHIKALSSNYALYGDMSHRVMEVLGRFTPMLEIYSIDEAFLDLGPNNTHLRDEAYKIVSTVRRWTGIPVSIGIGPTKGLAKVANGLAKTTNHVAVLSDTPSQTARLAELPVDALWGINKRWASKLQQLGIETALQLRDSDPKQLRACFGVVMERLAWELRGQPCLALETIAPPRKQIVVSRSFGKPITALDPLIQAAASYMARAAVKLRRQHGVVRTLSVFVQTNPFASDEPQYRNGCTLSLATHTSDTGILIRHTVEAVKCLYREGYRYKKVGVMLLDLVSADGYQGDLFAEGDDKRSKQRMALVDQINAVMGRGTVRFAREGLQQPWATRQTKRSPAYTTRWEQLPLVR
jgi:DNA polymerase V